MLLLPAGLRDDAALLPVTYFIGQDGRWYWQLGDIVRPLVGGGAMGTSTKYVNTFKKAHDGSDLVIDLVNDVVKFALFTNTITTNASTDASYGVAPYNANEVTGTGYTAGGVTLAGKTFTESPSGSLMFDCNDPAWTSATISAIRGGVGWDDTQTSPVDAVVYLQNFGADYAVTAGTLTVQEPATGVYADDITP